MMKGFTFWCRLACAKAAKFSAASRGMMGFSEEVAPKSTPLDCPCIFLMGMIRALMGVSLTGMTLERHRTPWLVIFWKSPNLGVGLIAVVADCVDMN